MATCFSISVTGRGDAEELDRTGGVVGGLGPPDDTQDQLGFVKGLRRLLSRCEI